MKKILVTLLLLNATATLAFEPEFPRPCELICTPMYVNLGAGNLIFVNWGNERKTYVLVERGAPIPQFTFDETELTKKGVRVQSVIAVFMWLPGVKGDLSVLPNELQEVMISHDDFIAKPDFNLKSKHDCDLLMYSLNENGDLVSKKIASESDVLTDFEIYSPKVSVLNPVEPNSSPYKQLKFKVFRNPEIIAPFAKIKLQSRLKELKNAGVCNKD